MATKPGANAANLKKYWPLGLILALAIGWFLLQTKPQKPAEEAILGATSAKAKTPPTPPKEIANGPKGAGPKHTGEPNPDNNSDEMKEKRLARAKHALEGYKHWARYPPGSRPLSEMPDLIKPHAVQKSTQPMLTKDGKTTKARVQLSQDRLYLVGDEAAHLEMTCGTSTGPLRCEVLKATANITPTDPRAGTIGPIPITFTDDGQSKAEATFAPAKEGFSTYHGGILIEAQVKIGEEQGSTNYQLIYTPTPPAHFTGKIRETLEDGSLCLHIQIDVNKPGRYVLAARADDASNEGFAYLEWNDLLNTGLQEVKMCIFGLLILDEQAKSPFTLRDLEGYLLHEDKDPDRELINTLEGKFHTTKTYENSAFSTTEWQSEEKKQRLESYEEDVEKAQNAAE